MKLIGRTFLRGLMVILPVTVTIYVLVWSSTAAETWLGSALQRVLPPGWYRPGMGVAAGILLVFLLGILMNLWLFRRLFRIWEKFVDRIPLVKTLYGSTRDLLGLFSGSDRQEVNQVVMVTLAPEMKLLGFVTREEFSGLPAAMGGLGTVAVYLPMSYQLGGFTVMMPRSAVVPIAMSIEDAMRFALTAGVPARQVETLVRRKPGA